MFRDATNKGGLFVIEGVEVLFITSIGRAEAEDDRCADVDTDYFDIAAGVLQGDILTPYLFIISLVYVL